MDSSDLEKVLGRKEFSSLADLGNHAKSIVKGKDEKIKVIDGKKYKAIKESKEPTKPTIHLFKETYKKIGGK